MSTKRGTTVDSNRADGNRLDSNKHSNRVDGNRVGSRVEQCSVVINGIYNSVDSHKVDRRLE